MKLIQLKQKHLKSFRKRILNLQHGKCPVLKQQIAPEDAVVDHLHKRKTELPDKNGKGCVRGVIQRYVNALEGTIYKKYIRVGLKDTIPLPELLRNLADYIENPPMFKGELMYIHPKEEIKIKKHKLGTLEKNRVYKYWNILYPKRKRPLQPKSGKVTKQWATYIEKANSYHEKITGKKLKRR